MAASGTEYGRGLAARIWHFFSGLSPESVAQVYSLDGQPQERGQHSAMLAAGAAAATAAGESVRSGELMSRARVVNHTAPGYYGSAWLALTDLVIRRGLASGPV
jgi:hypothetical protein